ncbi:MAG: PepSY-associated TM helix domain-containing protein, partial [Myxococcota bacterium]
HAELFVGPVGRLLVGLVAVAFLISLITGMIIYGPMMRRFRFGQLRRGRTSRTLVADLHKLLGVASAGWLLVVCVTGLLLSVGSVLLQVYAATELAALGAPYADEPVVEDLQSVDEAIVSAERESGRRWTIVALPGSDLASPRHYTVLLQGEDGLEARLLTMAMVDTEQPTEAQLQPLPWYMRALLLSEPLHFGDYGGLPLKIVWALFGLLTLVLAGSGVWVFTRTRKDASLRARSEALDAQTDLKARRS